MKKIIIATTLIALTSPAFAVTPNLITTCEKEYREKNKADNAAAPEGYKVKRSKGFKAEWMAECLNK